MDDKTLIHAINYLVKFFSNEEELKNYGVFLSDEELAKLKKFIKAASDLKTADIRNIDNDLAQLCVSVANKIEEKKAKDEADQKAKEDNEQEAKKEAEKKAKDAKDKSTAYHDRLINAKNLAERDAIYREIFSDQDIWGSDVSAFALEKLGYALRQEILQLGTTDKNPFIVFIKQVLPQIPLSDVQYNVIHNAYVDRLIDDNILRNTATKEEDKEKANLIRSPEFYKLTPAVMESRLDSEDGVSKKYAQGSWQELLTTIPVKRENAKDIMYSIAFEWARDNSHLNRLIQAYNLPTRVDPIFSKGVIDRMRRSNISTNDIDDVLKYIDNNYVQAREEPTK